MIEGAVMTSQRNVSDRAKSSNFDMARLSKSKQTVDVCPNTIREYARQGLNIYRLGKAAYFSKAELEQFIRTRGTVGATMRGHGQVVC